MQRRGRLARDARRAPHPPGRGDGPRHARLGCASGRRLRAEGVGLSRSERERELLAAACLTRTTRGTPLSQKLGAKPGAGVVVFFTTSRADLERRFAGLKRRSTPADGLWIAWPKKASKIETDLDFEAVQEIGLDAGLVDNKSAAIDERVAGGAVRLPAQR